MKKILEYSLLAMTVGTMYSCMTNKNMPQEENIHNQKPIIEKMDTLEIRINPHDSLPYRIIGPKEHLDKIRKLYEDKRKKQELEKKKNQKPDFFDMYRLTIPLDLLYRENKA